MTVSPQTVSIASGFRPTTAILGSRGLCRLFSFCLFIRGVITGASGRHGPLNRLLRFQAFRRACNYLFRTIQTLRRQPGCVDPGATLARRKLLADSAASVSVSSTIGDVTGGAGATGHEAPNRIPYIGDLTVHRIAGLIALLSSSCRVLILSCSASVDKRRAAWLPVDSPNVM